jgi:hypothetical protein
MPMHPVSLRSSVRKFGLIYCRIQMVDCSLIASSVLFPRNGNAIVELQMDFPQLHGKHEAYFVAARGTNAQITLLGRKVEVRCFLHPTDKDRRLDVQSSTDIENRTQGGIGLAAFDQADKRTFITCPCR